MPAESDFSLGKESFFQNLHSVVIIVQDKVTKLLQYEKISCCGSLLLRFLVSSSSMLQPSQLLCPSNTLPHSYLLILTLVVGSICLHFSPDGCVESAFTSFRPLHKCQLLQKALSDLSKRQSPYQVSGHRISGLSLAFTLFHCCCYCCYFIFFIVFLDI